MATLETPHLTFDLDGLYSELEHRKEEVIDTIADTVYYSAPVRTGYLQSTVTNDNDTIYVGADYGIYTEYRGKSAGWFEGAIEEGIRRAINIWTA